MTMREILFRGKRVDNGEWVEGDFCRPCNICFEEIGVDPDLGQSDVPVWNDYSVIPESVGQYTDLTDKNGKKIFEGDILKVKTMWHAEFPEDDNGLPTSPIKKETYWSVEYKNFRGDMGFMVYGIDRRWHAQMTWNKLYNAEAEIVGNIHDNPGLLGGDADGTVSER